MSGSTPLLRIAYKIKAKNKPAAGLFLAFVTYINGNGGFETC